jgi:transcription antitermination factor NusA-like protein
MGKIAVTSDVPMTDPKGICISKGAMRLSYISEELANTKLYVVL